ncbi:MAG: rRNA pseudouridine synthase [Victivallales bacterium]|nr:rRNA pseudouridine synthase [Victivallales bacterium]
MTEDMKKREEDLSTEASEEKGMRLARFLAKTGIGSRRSCEEYIREGRVTVNGVAVTAVGTCVTPGEDVVCFEGKPVTYEDSDKVYLMLNKPVGYTCSAKDSHAENLVYQLIPERFGRVFTVGRLDRDSEGLLILTNDGDFAQRLTHPSHEIYKRYFVECAGRFTTSVRRQLLDGMYDNGEYLHALNVEQVSVQHGACKLIFTLGEGRKREVRRLCKDVGLQVLLLRRIAIGQLELDEKLTVGSWRIMSPHDCELALMPVKVPERPRPAEPPRPYWVKDKPERKSSRPSRGGRGDDASRGPASRGTRDGFRRSRRSAPPSFPQPQRPWYEEDDSSLSEPTESRPPQRDYRRGSSRGDYRDDDAPREGGYGRGGSSRGGYRDDDAPREGGYGRGGSSRGGYGRGGYRNDDAPREGGYGRGGSSRDGYGRGSYRNDDAPREGGYGRGGSSRGGYGRGGYRDDAAPREGGYGRGGSSRGGKKPSRGSDSSAKDTGFRCNKPPRSWR